MIETENASFAYPDSPPLFRNVSFHVDASQILAVMGANGIGKTTLIKCIMGFLRLQTGRIFIGQKKIDRADMDDKSFWDSVAYVPQAKKSIFGYQVKEMVVLGRNASVSFGRVPSKRDYEYVDAVLERFGIADLREQSCNRLSGGQLQMVLIARALVKNPEVLILDEPESNLDLRNQMRVLNVIEKLAHEDGRAVILNTHFPTNALKISDTALLLKRDSYVFGRSSDIITEENIREFFKITCSIVSVSTEDGAAKGIVPIGAL
ncbi:ABC transporter ATP-binding protein [Treponema socranskii]|uniref:ABC transporter ATP-binding protein n=1 Tax=Treponema socranskii TaxID=53419 RepID=UPI003D8BD831